MSSKDESTPERKRRKLEQQQEVETVKEEEERDNEDDGEDDKKEEGGDEEEDEDEDEEDEDTEDEDEDEVEEEPSPLLDSINTLVLPDDILLSIFFHSFASSITKPNTDSSDRQNKRNYAQVCRHWCNLMNSRSLWVSLLRIVDDHHPVPSSTVALQKLVLGYSDSITLITGVWDSIAEVLVSKYKYDKESITIGDSFTEAEIRELESEWKIKLPLEFIALLRTPRVILPSDENLKEETHQWLTLDLRAMEYCDSWNQLLFDEDKVTTKQVKNWRFLQGLDCSAESVKESRREICDALKEEHGTVKSLPGVFVAFGERQNERFLEYSLLKEKFFLCYTSYANYRPDPLGDLDDLMKYFLEELQEVEKEEDDDDDDDDNDNDDEG